MRTHRSTPGKHPSLGDFLFGDYRRRVLGLLYARPVESFHVREIARLTEVPAGSLHRELRQLAQQGLVRAKPLGNQLRYSAAADAPVFEELASLLRKTAAAPKAPLPDDPRRRLAELCRRHHVARLGVFGAVARGDAAPESPVDVLVELEGGAAAPDMEKMRDELGAFLGRSANLATRAILDDPQRREAILRELKVLFPS